MNRNLRKVLLGISAIVIAACTGGPPELPYPAYVQVDELGDVFMASLPGVTAKQLSGDAMTRRTSNRIDLPKDWQGTSGGVPGRSMEIFIIAGELALADIVLESGGYAFLPAGSLGFNLNASDGARILYFVNDTDPEAVIRSPILINSELLPWQDTTTVGISTKELRSDPGSGAKTWLLRVSSGAAPPWQSSSATREGYLLSGNQQYAECVNGEIEHGQYVAGGYFYRPADTINGGPDSLALRESIWVMRETEGSQIAIWPSCIDQAANAQP